jgi:NAD(P)-dependent dehydrogenase (short-subunit alcohol dehydrogenase family)
VGKGGLLAVECDSSSEIDVDNLVETVVRRVSKLGVLIRNGAVSDDMGLMRECGMGMWERNIKVRGIPLILGVKAMGEW